MILVCKAMPLCFAPLTKIDLIIKVESRRGSRKKHLGGLAP